MCAGERHGPISTGTGFVTAFVRHCSRTASMFNGASWTNQRTQQATPSPVADHKDSISSPYKMLPTNQALSARFMAGLCKAP